LSPSVLRLAGCVTALAAVAAMSRAQGQENPSPGPSPLAAHVEKILAPLSGDVKLDTQEWGGAVAGKDVRELGVTYVAALRASRQQAEEELISLGREATPLLAKLLRSKSEAVARSLAHALGEIGDASAELALVETMNDAERGFELRVYCAAALAKWKKDAGGALLIAGLRLANELTSIGRAVRKALPLGALPNVVALERLQNDSAALRDAALAGLRALLNRNGYSLPAENGNPWEPAWAAEKRWAEANKPTTVDGFIVDPWGNEARYRDQIGARNGHRSVVDRMRQAAIEKYVEMALPAESPSRVVRSLVEARTMIEALPPDHPSFSKYSLRGSVKVKDKVFEYLWDKQAQKWDHVGLVWVGVDGLRPASKPPMER